MLNNLFKDHQRDFETLQDPVDLSDKTADFDRRRKEEQKKIDKQVKKDMHEVEEIFEAGNLSEEKKAEKMKEKILKLLQEMNKQEVKAQKISTQSVSAQQVSESKKEIAKFV